MALKKLSPYSKNNTDQDRIILFWSNVKKTKSCWIWTGCIDPTGYGKFGFNHKSVRVHRFVWQLVYGPIPKDKQINHHCDNRRCCNPKHLYVGTQKDNVRDQLRRGRRNQRGELNNSVKLNENTVRLIKKHIVRGVKQDIIAEKFNIARTTVSAISTGRSWSWV